MLERHTSMGAILDAINYCIRKNMLSTKHIEILQKKGLLNQVDLPLLKNIRCSVCKHRVCICQDRRNRQEALENYEDLELQSIRRSGGKRGGANRKKKSKKKPFYKSAAEKINDQTGETLAKEIFTDKKIVKILNSLAEQLDAEKYKDLPDRNTEPFEYYSRIVIVLSHLAESSMLEAVDKALHVPVSSNRIVLNDLYYYILFLQLPVPVIPSSGEATNTFLRLKKEFESPNFVTASNKTRWLLGYGNINTYFAMYYLKKFFCDILTLLFENFVEFKQLSTEFGRYSANNPDDGDVRNISFKVAMLLRLFYTEIDSRFLLENIKYFYEPNNESVVSLALKYDVHNIIKVSRDDFSTIRIITPSQSQTIQYNGVDFVFLYCPPGSFITCEPVRYSSKPSLTSLLRITLTKGYWMLETPVTQEMWTAVMTANPSAFQSSFFEKKSANFQNTKSNFPTDTARFPVERIDWSDAIEFCRVFSEKTDRKVDLPTVAQWEYACNAGANLQIDNLPIPIDKFGWVKKNSSKRTHSVKQKLPNAWGFYDLFGNVWEWNRDAVTGQSRALLSPIDLFSGSTGSEHLGSGGSWNQDGYTLRANSHYSLAPGSDVGFRIIIEEN